MKLFGYKRWYEEKVKDEQGKSYYVKKKLKKDNYKILTSKDNKEIEEDVFIEKLKNYKIKENGKCKKINGLEIIGRKFSKNNILFKIKKKEFKNKLILKQSKKLGKYNQDNNRGKNLYQKCENINKSVFSILKTLISKRCDRRKFIEYYIHEINENSINEIFEKFKELKEICSNNEEVYKELKFYLNISKNNYEVVSDIKKIFVSKLEGYFLYDVELKKGDISEFLVKEAIFYDILKREEKNPEKVNDYLKENWKNVWIKTYIKNDKHNSYLDNGKNKDTVCLEKVKESEKIKTIQELLGKDIKDIIENIFKLYKIDDLIENLRNEEINDTNLFGVYKAHYEENVKKEMENYIKIKNDEKDNSKKLIAKIVYRYIKGRVEKIITYKCKDKLDKIFKKDILKEKIIKRVEQYIIENLIYLGKVKILTKEPVEKNISEKFIEYGIKEELELEFLNFVSATNLKLNELFKNQKNERAVFDYFANINEKIDNHFKSLDITKSETILRNRLKIDVDKFKTYLEIMASVRSEIVHRGNSKEDNTSLFDYYKTSKKISPKLEEDCKNVIQKINELKVSDEEICKNLNFDILFNNENIKNIIGKINNIGIGNTNTIYFPTYSRLVPRIENELREAVSSKNFNDREFSILKNAFIYLNKVLYYKTISNWKEEKEEEYKNTQIRASKGDKKAIKKFQNKFIDEYLEKIKTEYEDLFNFNYLKNIEVGISEANGERNLDKKYILKSSQKDIEIKNDFEYIIIVSALIMNDNTYINKFRNRLFSTFTALESMNSDIENLKDIQNLIEILDIIIDINKGKRDYRNEQLLNSNDKIEKIKKEIKNLKIEIQNITLTKQDYIHIVECCKDKLFDTNKKIKPKHITELYDECSTKTLEKSLEINSTNIREFCKDNCINLNKVNMIKELQNKQKEIDDLKNSGELSEFFRKNGDITLFEKTENLKKFKNLLEKEKLISELESSKEVLNKYIEEMEEITKNDKKDKRKFEELYYQKNNALIYKKNLFYYISQDSFRKIYDKFLKEDLENVSTSKIKNNNEIAKKISDVNKILTDINNYIHGFSKEYKENFAKNIENFFKKRKYNGIETFEKFKAIYDEVKEYKSNKSIVEMAIIGKLMNYLIEINWKLAMQISRIERDIDYLYNGVITIDSKLEIEDKDAKLRLNKVLEYCKNKQNSHIFKSLEELREDLETVRNENKNSTRNRVVHFELLQNPFKNDSLIEIINKVSKLSEYRTRYNNSVYNSCFEIFKKDFDLNYEKLKKKFKLSCSSTNSSKDNDNSSNNDEKIFKIKDILSPKKVSILNLEENDELLAKVEKFFEYKIED